MVKTRFAPSPTGLMHIGGVRTALYAFLAARKSNGIFSLRIEDTDRKRFIPGATEDIIENLKWLGLNFDGQPIIQSERLELYEKYASKLLEKGLAYEKEGAIWFKFPLEGKIEYTDLIGNRKVEFDNSSQKDFVILKSDGFPTYHLAHMVDDHLMETNLVIRGDEWMSSVPKHIMLFKAFEWEIPQYAHLPLILGPDRSKLSKRHGARSVSEFRKEGYLPLAILNYMALLGWAPPSGKETLTTDEMIRDFDLKDVHIAPAIFDIKKLEWMNGMYIRKLTISNFKFQISNFLGDKIKKIDDQILDKFIPLAQTRMTTLNEFYDLVTPFFEESKVILNEKEKQVAKKLLDNLSSIKEWNNETILAGLKKITQDEKIRMSMIYKILTGRETGLPLPESFEILGKERTIKKLENVILVSE